MFDNGIHLRAARVMADMTQIELADAAGLHRNAVKYWESPARMRGCAGHAVALMAAVLRDRGVSFGYEYSDAGKAFVVRSATSHDG